VAFLDIDFSTVRRSEMKMLFYDCYGRGKVIFDPTLQNLSIDHPRKKTRDVVYEYFVNEQEFVDIICDYGSVIRKIRPITLDNIYMIAKNMEKVLKITTFYTSTIDHGEPTFILNIGIGLQGNSAVNASEKYFESHWDSCHSVYEGHFSAVDFLTIETDGNNVTGNHSICVGLSAPQKNLLMQLENFDALHKYDVIILMLDASDEISNMIAVLLARFLKQKKKLVIALMSIEEHGGLSRTREKENVRCINALIKQGTCILLIESGLVKRLDLFKNENAELLITGSVQEWFVMSLATIEKLFNGGYYIWFDHSPLIDLSKVFAPGKMGTIAIDTISYGAPLNDGLPGDDSILLVAGVDEILVGIYGENLEDEGYHYDFDDDVVLRGDEGISENLSIDLYYWLRRHFHQRMNDKKVVAQVDAMYGLGDRIGCVYIAMGASYPSWFTTVMRS
jgi:hypothetical protein